MCTPEHAGLVGFTGNDALRALTHLAGVTRGGPGISIIVLATAIHTTCIYITELDHDADLPVHRQIIELTETHTQIYTNLPVHTHRTCTHTEPVSHRQSVYTYKTCTQITKIIDTDLPV